MLRPRTQSNKITDQVTHLWRSKRDLYGTTHPLPNSPHRLSNKRLTQLWKFLTQNMFVPFSYGLSTIVCLRNTVICRLLALGLYIFVLLLLLLLLLIIIIIIIITFTFIATLPLPSNGALQQQVIFLQKKI